MTDTAKYVANALLEMSLVKSEEALLGWHEVWMNSVDYLHLTEGEAQQLEDAYQRKAGWFMGVMS